MRVLLTCSTLRKPGRRCWLGAVQEQVRILQLADSSPLKKCKYVGEGAPILQGADSREYTFVGPVISCL